MANPFAFIEEIREMNIILTSKLERIITQLDELLLIERDRDTQWYGDGK